ncbi:MAG: ComF family protein [Candidatus Sungbacteria bacterium]|nr:ComF family protein [Candidatus Sungbacteria bacterium]
MWINLTEIKGFALDLVFPKTCLLCLQEKEFLCATCAKTLTFREPSCFVCRKRDLEGKTCPSCREKTLIRRFYRPFSYKDETVRKLIHVYKYERAKEIARPLGGFIISAMQKAGFPRKKTITIIPIPLHWRKKRERGFNQTEPLAEIIGAFFGLPVLSETLIRTKNTSAQIEMENNLLRRQNITGAFAVKNPAAVVEKTILLIDDVITSGATVEEAAATLKKAGARSVWLAAIAGR